MSEAPHLLLLVRLSVRCATGGRDRRGRPIKALRRPAPSGQRQARDPGGERAPRRRHRGRATRLAEDGLPPPQAGDDRVAIARLPAGPGISNTLRAAAGAALDDNTPESLRHFLEAGQYGVGQSGRSGGSHRSGGRLSLPWAAEHRMGLPGTFLEAPVVSGCGSG
ncbi:ALF repeat-containing protein [Streptomyces sp. Amel2xE9]|uniref:ALF repeat-containing protein n=1 Tax=Streptomyces sp. Amel2xE9 TaxID=1157634 RepID=UPI003B636FE2